MFTYEIAPDLPPVRKFVWLEASEVFAFGIICRCAGECDC